MMLDFQLSYKKIYFDNAYHTDGMYKISTTIPSVINEISTSAHSSTLWHNKLDHVNYRFSIKKLGLFPSLGVISLKNVKSAYRPRS